MGEDAPIRPVAEKPWLKETGLLPLGGDTKSSRVPDYDVRAASSGGCDSPGHFEGCHVFYIKVRCSATAVGRESFVAVSFIFSSKHV